AERAIKVKGGFRLMLAVRADFFHRIRPGQDHAEVPAGAEVMIHAAVADRDFLAARPLAIYDTGQIEAGLADKKAAGLQQKRGPCEARLTPEVGEQRADARSDDI